MCLFEINTWNTADCKVLNIQNDMRVNEENRALNELGESLFGQGRLQIKSGSRKFRTLEIIHDIYQFAHLYFKKS